VTVSLQTYKQQLVASGVIAVNIPVMTTSDLRVVDVDDTTGAETAVPVGQYTLTLTTPTNLPSLVSINITTTAAAGFTRWVYRLTANVQDLDYFAEGAFDSGAHERAIDKRTLISIEGWEKAGILGVQAPISEVRTTPLLLPPASVRASKVFGFDGAGEPTAIVAVPADSVAFTPNGQSLVEAANYAAMRTLLTLDIGSDVQAWDTDLDDIAALGHVAGNVIQSAGGVWTSAAIAVQQMPRGHLWGVEMVRSAAQTIQFTAGERRDEANTQNMVLAAALSKTINGAWSPGNGSGGNGDTVLTDTWYHAFLIRSGAGVIDAGFDRDITATNLLALSGYTEYRRVGSVYRSVVPDIPLFIQNGDHFLWETPPLDIDDTDPGTGEITPAISVPLGVKVMAHQRWAMFLTIDTFVLITGMDQANQAVNNLYVNPPPLPLADWQSYVNSNGSVMNTIRLTDTSRRIRYRLHNSNANTRIRATTIGWMDTRGRLN
jgi:hypothetical protein